MEILKKYIFFYNYLHNFFVRRGASTLARSPKKQVNNVREERTLQA